MGDNRTKPSSGFTLIELLLSIAILMLIGSFSAVFFSNFMVQNSVFDTQDQFVGQLRKAQLYSMMGKENSAWGVQYASNTITLFKGSTYASRDSAFDEKFHIDSGISVAGFNEVDFSKATGIPANNLTFTIYGNGTSKSVTINSQGVVTR